jgi:hypothetical protein
VSICGSVRGRRRGGGGGLVRVGGCRPRARGARATHACRGRDRGFCQLRIQAGRLGTSKPKLDGAAQTRAPRVHGESSRAPAAQPPHGQAAAAAVRGWSLKLPAQPGQPRCGAPAARCTAPAWARSQRPRPSPRTSGAATGSRRPPPARLRACWSQTAKGGGGGGGCGGGGPGGVTVRKLWTVLMRA